VYVLLPGSDQDLATRMATGALNAILRRSGARSGRRTVTNPMELPTMRREVDDILHVIAAQPDLPANAVSGRSDPRVSED
jgi:hypothetical protein